ncbi:N-acetylneuraminate synthase [Rhodothermus sp. AH-315-K08]|nr:N-acetylneuraminate synthase [Rhodothermus sp. AH-315-K08]
MIAEAGVNHNGDLATALALVDAAAECGADAVKFQTFKADTIVRRDAKKAAYQEGQGPAGETQYEMLKRLELDHHMHLKILDHCRARQIHFMSSAFDLDGIDYLRRLGMELFKIPSGEIDNLPYLRKVGAIGRRVILSTGASELEEVREAVEILTKAGTGLQNITVLHCCSQYPTLPEDVNLAAMLTMRDILGVQVGYSDHTLGSQVAIAATAMGATVIEKHLTLNSTDSRGPDHKASLDPAEFADLVRSIRIAERAMGDGVKRIATSEAANRYVIRKSIVASRRIERGEILTGENVTVKRPQGGLSPMRWDAVIGSTALREYKTDEGIDLL